VKTHQVRNQIDTAVSASRDPLHLLSTSDGFPMLGHEHGRRLDQSLAEIRIVGLDVQSI
jgi:hypothetical protein